MDTSAIDYDLHGLAGVRLLDATALDAAAVDRQLGPIRAPLERDPDIVVRFVDRLEVKGPVHVLGDGEAGFTEDAFLILRGAHKAPARVRIPLERVGERCDITCERGLSAVPLLIAVLNLTVLAHGALPLHASAFLDEGRGIVVTGWSKGGKTEALLAFAAHGARFVADEWVYVDPDDATVRGIQEPIRVWDWYLQQLPALRTRIPVVARARLAALRAAERPARSPRVVSAIRGQRHVDVSPAQLFGDDVIARTAPFDTLFLLGSWEEQRTVAEPIDPAEVAARMAFSLEHERAPLVSAYQRFRFAFPDRRNALLEDAPARERALLERLTAGKAAHAVHHPYPADLERLYEAMRPLR